MTFFNKSIFALLVLFSNTAFATTFSDIRMYYPEMTWNTLNQNFQLCRIDSNNALPIYDEKSIKVYFKENSDEVSEYYKEKLTKFMEELPKTTVALHLEGHADQCGKADENQDLSLRRGNNTWDVIKEYLKGTRLKITGKAHGESESHDHSIDDKYAQITIKYIPKRKFERVVLLDISGSLDRKLYGRTDTGITLNQIKQISFKKGSIVYVVRGIEHKCDGTDLKNYKPVGEDFYNNARILMAHQLRGKKTKGYLYTDFGDIRRNNYVEQDLRKMGSYEKILWYIL